MVLSPFAHSCDIWSISLTQNAFPIALSFPSQHVCCNLDFGKGVCARVVWLGKKWVDAVVLYCILLWIRMVISWAEAKILVGAPILFRQQQLSYHRHMVSLLLWVLLTHDSVGIISISKWSPIPLSKQCIVCPCQMVSFNHIESPSEHLLSYYVLGMNFDSTNNSIILKYIVKGTHSTVSPGWYICLRLNLPSLCIIRS